MKKVIWLLKFLIDEFVYIDYVYIFWLQGLFCMDSNNFVNLFVLFIFIKFWIVFVNYQVNISGFDFLIDIDILFF